MNVQNPRRNICSAVLYGREELPSGRISFYPTSFLNHRRDGSGGCHLLQKACRQDREQRRKNLSNCDGMAPLPSFFCDSTICNTLHSRQSFLKTPTNS